MGRKIFEIRDGAVFVSVRRFGRLRERRVSLSSLNLDYGTVAQRNHGAIVYSLGGVMLFGGISWALWHLRSLPAGAGMLLLYLPTIALGLSLISLIRWCPRMEFYVFTNHWRRQALAIMRERAQGEACDEFVRKLVVSIEADQATTPPANLADLLAAQEGGVESSDGLAGGFQKWRASLAFGVMACALPLVPPAAHYLGALLFPLVFAFCVAAALFCVLSFAAKEPRRWWSLLGLASSLVPPFFS